MYSPYPLALASPSTNWRPGTEALGRCRSPLACHSFYRPPSPAAFSRTRSLLDPAPPSRAAVRVSLAIVEVPRHSCEAGSPKRWPSANWIEMMLAFEVVFYFRGLNLNPSPTHFLHSGCAPDHRYILSMARPPDKVFPADYPSARVPIASRLGTCSQWVPWVVSHSQTSCLNPSLHVSPATTQD